VNFRSSLVVSRTHEEKVMLYLEEPEYNRLKDSADLADKSMNAFLTGLIWNYDAPVRVVAELSEYKCKRCGKTIWTDTWLATTPDRCSFPGCGGEMVDCGRWGTLILGRIR